MKKIILVASVLAVLAGGISAASLPPYQLPIATTSTLGGLKPDGTTITVDGTTGVASASLTGAALTPTNNLSDVSSVATSRVNLAIDQRTAYAADTDQTITSASRYVVTTTAFTAARTFTLPAASTLNAGEPLLIKDSGSINGANTLIIARAGSDTIDGNTSFTIPVAYGALGLRSNGTNGWEVDANLTLAGATCSAGSYVSAITSTGGVTCTAIPTATSSVLGLVKPDNTTLTNTAGAISCTTGTTSQLGCLKPDGVIITDVAGTITVPKSSSSVFGVAEVDNVTITATAGVLTAIGGAATTVTAGTTSVSGTCTSGYNLYNNAGVIGCQANSGGGGIVVGTTTISSGTSGKIEYNNAGVVGELTAPLGAIVGTTDTQTLTNKSIVGSEINSGTVAVANGGTGLSSTPANGALNIGNGSGFTQATITAGSNITVTNGTGSITIASTGGGSGASAIQPAFQTGQYYTMFGARSDGAFLPSANRLYAVPFSNQTGSSVTFTKAAINVTTLASSTACEIGLYTDSSGLPGTLISDIGNVVTTTTGQKTISSLSLAVPSGLSWLVVGCNGAPQISGMTNTNNGPFTSFVGYTDGNLTGNQQMYAAWTYSVGGLPGTFPTAVYNSGAGQPLVWIGK